MKKLINVSLGDWHNDKPTKAQLDYIRHIWEESEWPLQPFTGKTKGEAAEWIDKNRYYAYHSMPEESEELESWGDR